ncbi:histidine phosphatase family protein [Desulforegula conservatrix]|uniref:histidine phosphatase family protein n=1 Tax=Desulforegula conservatrix TaxID=153026 RepID=UPI0003FA41B4|nr:histidine phosphatase family protein [Desulforegula conservatrix]
MIKNKDGSMESIELINRLAESGASRISIIMRHAARKYDQDMRKEPFLGLTDEGKQAALEFGRNIPPDFELRPYSSYIGRCIETAYLMDKGYSMIGGNTRIPEIEERLAPFYIVDIKKILSMAASYDVFAFIRKWIDGDIPEDIMMSPYSASIQMIDFLKQGLEDDKPVINVCITHDWNMYLIREIFLGLMQEEAGEVAFLEGIAVYEKGGELYITGKGIERQITDILPDEELRISDDD